MWTSIAGFLLAGVTWLAGIAGAMLPSRWWPTLDLYVPASNSAALAAVCTILTAGAIGVPGFVRHTQEQVSRNNAAILAAAAQQAAAPAHAQSASDRDWGRAFLGASSLSLFTFVLLTPAGWAATYLGLSGTWRGMAAAVDDPFGDPILTGLDALVLASVHRSRSRIKRTRRERLEGPAVADRVVRGSHIGIPGAEFVIVAARPKPLWDVGTVVDTGTRWFRVTAMEERTIGGRLRTLYALAEHRDLEVIRRPVQYAMPAHVEARRAD